MSLELIQQFEDLLEGLNLLLQTLLNSVRCNFQAECQRNEVEGILLFFIIKLLHVFEEFVLGRDLLVMLVMVDHLDKVV